MNLIFGEGIDRRLLFCQWLSTFSELHPCDIVKVLRKKCTHSKMTPHMARHTFAKNLVNSGVTLEKVAMLLGHTSLDTTMVYTTPALSDLDQAV